MSRLRVMIVSSHLKAMGGAEKNVLDVARGLKSRCDIEVVGLQCGPLVDEFARRGIPVTDVGVRKILSLRGLIRAFRLAKRLRAGKFDLVVTYHHDADLWAGFAAWLARVPVISSRRDMGYQLSAAHLWIYRIINRFFGRIVAVSDAVKKEIIRTQWAAPDLVMTVYNGLEFVDGGADRSSTRLELGLDPARPVVGMVSSFRPVKGQEFFVRAAAEVARRRPDAQFVIVGDTDSSYFREVQGIIRELGLENDVHCIGARSDIPRVMSAFDVFVLPSRQEGFSNALVEAMAAGVPPVASSVGGNPEAVDHGVNGLLFDMGDTGQLARHILTLLDNQESRERMSVAARAKVAEAFSYEGMLDRLYHLFEEVA